MTLTVKLDPVMEERLRARAASTGRSTSELVRAALQDYLAAADAAPARSAFSLGHDLFGRFSAGADLASSRKQVAADEWAAKHRAR